MVLHSMILLLLCALIADAVAETYPECPEPTQGFKSENRAGALSIEYKSTLPFDCLIYWVDFNGEEKAPSVLPAMSTQPGSSYDGHAFRFRTYKGVLLLEARATPTTLSMTVEACGDTVAVETQLFDEEEVVLFESLVTKTNECVGPSSNWSCVRRLTEAEVAKRNPDEYGFTEAESKRRKGVTIDYGYVKQIAAIPKLSQGPGYLHMKMTPKMWEILHKWFENTRDQIEEHEHIPGGYTNNEWLGMSKLNLDKFPGIRSEIVREMQHVLQWWTNTRLKHTSTYGVRIYRRDSMLIDHVDRQDTHLASAVIQVAQSTDEDGGWPLEVLLPNKTVGEVYLQPGEMVLYEGAWLRHGRPMRFKGTEFANIFSHFAPLDWSGPSVNSREINEDTVLPNIYNGYEPGRCNTIADDRSSGKGCIEPTTQPADSHDEL